MERLLAVTALLLLGLACQAPFGEDRHDLVGDRITAVATRPVAGGTQAEVALVVDGALWTDVAIAERWYAAADADAVDPEAPPDAEGPLATLPTPVTDWTLVVTFPSGAERRAVLRLPEGGAAAMPAPPLSFGTLDLDFDAATPEQLSVDGRSDLAATPSEAIASGAWARVTAWPAGPPDNLDRVRWTSTAQPSTFLELDRTTTDWATGTLILDDLEIEEATPMSPGVVTLLALAVDGAGGNGLGAIDIAVGAVDAPTVRVAGRLLGVELAPSAALLQGTLEADDTLPSGLRLADAVAVAAPAAAALPCADGPLFDPSWLLTRRCLRAEVVGATVTVQVQPSAQPEAAP
jgi:hypothetical protein